MCEFYLALSLLKEVHNRVEIRQFEGVCLFPSPLQHHEMWVIPTGSPPGIVPFLSVLLEPLGGATGRCQGILVSTAIVYFGPDQHLADTYLP